MMAFKLEGRLFKPEVINFGESTCPTGPQCDWGRNIDNSIKTPVTHIHTWIVVVCERDRNRAQDFVQTWIEVGYRMGMIIKPPRLITLNNDRTDTFVNCIREEIQPKVKLIIHYLFLITDN